MPGIRITLKRVIFPFTLLVLGDLQVSYNVVEIFVDSTTPTGTFFKTCYLKLFIGEVAI